MARSGQASALAGEMTADEQAQLDQMRADDAVVEQPQETPVVDDTQAPDEPADGQQPVADDRPKTVPHAALHEERERRKAIEQQLAEERRARQTLEERTNLILQQRLGQQPAPAQLQTPALPEVDKDPVGHIIGRMVQQEQVMGAVIQALQGVGQQNQQTQVVNQIVQRAQVMEQQFAQTTPDYAPAVAHLAEQRHKELEAAGWIDPAERQQIISREAMQLAAQAMQQNRNPAEVVYSLAKIRGYQTPAPAAPATDTTQRLEQVSRGQQQSARSLGNVRGSGPAPMNANSLLQMSDDEFEKAFNTKEGRELFGA